MDKKIINWWWEEDSFFTEDEEGQIYRFENAHVSNVSWNYENDKNIVTTVIPADYVILQLEEMFEAEKKQETAFEVAMDEHAKQWIYEEEPPIK